MNRNSLLASIGVLVAMMAVIGVAVYFLYRDVDVEDRDVPELPVAASVVSRTSGEVAAIPEPVSEKTVSNPESTVPEECSVKAEITVSKGPFEVMNSKTRRKNQFIQNTDNSLVLKDNGKSLWVASFKTPICGRAENVDYYANGNLQIAFCSGSGLYVIDRLGRFVKGFPVSLGKKVLLGPDVYDFNGQRRYNVMVLHEDNTVEMYNFKGQKPAEWKTVTAKDRILGLPEAVSVGGKTFWAVRTVSEMLIFPFYGGKPVLDLSGDSCISNKSAIRAVGSTSVAVEMTDGSEKTFKIR